jgi:hypothetical protein
MLASDEQVHDVAETRRHDISGDDGICELTETPPARLVSRLTGR